MRMNIFLQRSGIGSRREAERMVLDGRVLINGRTAKVTDPVEPTDEVMVDGAKVTIETRPLPRLFILHKPIDVLVTTFDKEGRKTIFDLPALKPPVWHDRMPRVMNVGRLDVNSEGLLLMSSDGPLAQAMMSPKTGLERVYRIRVHGRLNPSQIKQLSRGVTVNGVRYRGAKITEDRKPTGANTWYTIVLTEGKNREIRKLMEHFGCVVNRLIRTSYGPFTLNDLPEGGIQEIPPVKVRQFVQELQAKGALK